MAETLRHIVTPVAKAAGVGAVVGLGVIGVGTELVDHRLGSHGVIKLTKPHRKGYRLEQKTLGVPGVGEWHMTHRTHHREEDGSSYSAIKRYRAIQSLRPGDLRDLPKTLKHIDPYVEDFPLEALMEIGRSGDDYLEERLGAQYKEPGRLSDDAFDALLYPTKPDYYYRPFRKAKGDYSFDELSHIMTTDPHSWSFLDPIDSFVLRHFQLYKTSGNLFKEHPELKDSDLHHPDEENLRSLAPEVTAGIVLASAVALATRNKKLSVASIAQAAAMGGAFTGGRALVETQAGLWVNLLGHIGDPSREELRALLMNKEYIIRPQQDGTISTNLTKVGPLGATLGFMTGGDGGTQKNHHDYPDWNHFSDQTGVRGFLEDPVGATFEAAAQSPLIPFIQPGEGVPTENGRRVDAASERMEIIHELRREDIKTGKTPQTVRRLFPQLARKAA